MDKEIKRWYKKVWLTKGARFNAYRRLRSKLEWSTYSIIIFSVYIIALNSLVFIEPFNSSYTAGVITIINIVLSVFILAISIHINSKDYKVESLSHHECGKELAGIYNKLASIIDREEYSYDIGEYIERYQVIINNHQYNHEPIDLSKVLIDDREIETNLGQKLATNFRFYILPISLYLFLIILPPVIFFLVILK